MTRFTRVWCAGKALLLDQISRNEISLRPRTADSLPKGLKVNGLSFESQKLRPQERDTDVTSLREIESAWGYDYKPI